MSIVETVARALGEYYDGKPITEPVNIDDIGAAKVAIAAMRVPTDAMIDAVNDWGGDLSVDDCWRKMIDEALR